MHLLILPIIVALAIFQNPLFSNISGLANPIRIFRLNFLDGTKLAVRFLQDLQKEEPGNLKDGRKSKEFYGYKTTMFLSYFSQTQLRLIFR